MGIVNRNSQKYTQLFAPFIGFVSDIGVGGFSIDIILLLEDCRLSLIRIWQFCFVHDVCFVSAKIHTIGY